MALRAPTVYLRRRAGTPPKPPTPRVVARRMGQPGKTSAFPILPAVAATLVLLASAQLGMWWWESRLPGVPEMEMRRNPFMALMNREPAPERGRLREPQRLITSTLPQNLQFGDGLARVTVTIFSDPSCGPCREKVRAWTAGLPAQGVRQVYKFWPSKPERLTPGLLVELARRQGVVPTFWRSLQGAGTANLDDGQLLTMLDHAGVPLDAQRTALTQEGPALTASVEPDIALAKAAHLPEPPVLLVDDYVLDGYVLSPDNLNSYVQKRLEGRQIFEHDDLFLMRK